VEEVQRIWTAEVVASAGASRDGRGAAWAGAERVGGSGRRRKPTRSWPRAGGRGDGRGADGRVRVDLVGDAGSRPARLWKQKSSRQRVGGGPNGGHRSGREGAAAGGEGQRADQSWGRTARSRRRRLVAVEREKKLNLALVLS
jgi:hypothetical protein